MDSCSTWWNDATVAVVTGGNKGIGLEVCKQLGEKGLRVILTARDGKLGLAAAKALNEQGLHNVVYHQLDVQDEQSIANFTSWLSKEHGGVDILMRLRIPSEVQWGEGGFRACSLLPPMALGIIIGNCPELLINNAAVSGVIFNQEYFKAHNIDTLDSMLKTENPEGYIIEYESAKLCLHVNYYGAKHVTKALIPLLRSSSEGARIVNVGSSFGQLYHLPSKKLQQELADEDNLSERYIDDLLDKYLDDVKSKSLEDKAWPILFPSYKMSKVALHAYTRILARDLEKRRPSQRILVNCVHPGFVNTDLNYHQGDLTPAEGAQNVVRVALFPHQDCPSGKFFDQNTLSNF